MPNGKSIGLAAVLVAMWYAGASQGNGAAYLLCFVLTGLAAVSSVHAWANVRGVEVTAEPIAPVFAGDEIRVPLAVRSTRGRARFGIQVSSGSGKTTAPFDEVASDGVQRRILPVPAPRRGCYRELRLQVGSLYPLGFFTARRRVIVAQTFFVYPQPIGTTPLPRALAPTRHPRDGTRHEGDDFGGVRVWRAGESQRHIDWKAAARGRSLLTKQWTGEADEILCFDWQALAPLEVEARLSQLAKWLVVAERSGATYALRLPGKTFEASRGEKHFHACLRALAQFDGDAGHPAGEPAP